MSAADDLLSHLSRLEAELHHPGVRCSRERIEALLHPQFHEVGRSGTPYARPTVITALLQEQPPRAVKASGYQVHPLGDGWALLTYRSAEERPDGSLARAALRSSVWCRSALGWQLFYHQGTPEADSRP